MAKAPGLVSRQAELLAALAEWQLATTALQAQVRDLRWVSDEAMLRRVQALEDAVFGQTVEEGVTTVPPAEPEP